MPFNNPNADWLNFRGTWVTNVLIAVALKGLFACVPGMTNELAWTLTNLTYNIVSPSTVLIVTVVYFFLFPLALRHAL
jgi:hypothetical protein